jgi:hypothetical protein
MLVYRFVNASTRLNSTMKAVNREQAGYSSTAIPMDDLRSAVSASIQWDSIDPTLANPPYDPAVNPTYLPWFQVHDTELPLNATPVSYVCYRYRASDQALLREYISGGPPTASPITSCGSGACGQREKRPSSSTAFSRRPRRRPCFPKTRRPPMSSF